MNPIIIEVLHGLTWFLIIFSLIIDILCYKYRHLARFYIYYQFIRLIVVRMLPNVEGAVLAIQPLQFSMMFGAFNLAYYCDQPASIILQIFLFQFQFFFTCPVLFFQKLTVMRVVTIIMTNLITFNTVLIFAAGIVYISQI